MNGLADDQVFQGFGLLALDRQQAGAEQPGGRSDREVLGYRLEQSLDQAAERVRAHGPAAVEEVRNFVFSEYIGDDRDQRLQVAGNDGKVAETQGAAGFNDLLANGARRLPKFLAVRDALNQ